MTVNERQQQIEALTPEEREWLSAMPAWSVKANGPQIAGKFNALAARLSGLQDTLAAIYDLCPASVKRPPLPGPDDPPEWEALRKIAALALNTDGEATAGARCVACGSAKSERGSCPSCGCLTNA